MEETDVYFHSVDVKKILASINFMHTRNTTSEQTYSEMLLTSFFTHFDAGAMTESKQAFAFQY